MKPIEGLDPGIADAVNLLRKKGYDTFTSCEGGEGHAFKFPTIRLWESGGSGVGAVQCLRNGGFKPVLLSKCWILEQATPPFWQIELQGEVTGESAG